MATYARRKRGAVIDLKRDDGAAVFRRLVEGADVVLHNFRPAAAGRLKVAARTRANRESRRLIGVS